MNPAPTWDDFVTGWELDLYQDPLLAAAAVGAVLGFLSVYVVLRRMVFTSAAVTQSAALGVATSFYVAIHWGVTVDPSLGAVMLALAAAAVLAVDPTRLGITRETLLGLIYALTGGAALIVGSKIAQEAHDIHAILYGPAVVVSEVDLDRVLWFGLPVLALQIWWFRGFSFASFDPVAARAQKVPVLFLDVAMLLSIGVMVGVSARALGALPVFALSTMPGAAALLLTRGHLAPTFAVATVLGALAGTLGYIVAFFREWPVGGSQTAVAAAFVAAALAVRGAIKLVARKR